MEPDQKNAEAGAATVLVVEDERGVRELISEFLNLDGHTVLEAENGAEAVKISEAHDGPIHLLLSDVVMPGMNGFQVSEAISADRPDLKVIFISGYANVEEYDQGVLGPDSLLLQKPITADSLRSVVKAVLRNEVDPGKAVGAESG